MIENKDIKLYIESIDSQEFMIKLMTNEDLCNYIIKNNILWNNMDIFLKKFGRDKVFEIFKLLSFHDTNKKLINEEMYTIFECVTDKQFFISIFNYINIKQMIPNHEFNKLIVYMIKNKCKNISYEFVEYLFSINDKSLIKNNFEEILKKFYYLFDLKELVKEDKELVDRLNNYINNNPENLIYEMLIKGFDLDLNIIKNEKIFDTVKTIIYELLENENLNYSDINYIGNGAYNYVFEIGSKVLKIGKKREIFVMENNKRFLKPILRTQIDSILNEKILGCIEITEKVNTDGIDEVDAYIIYEELRNNGYIWVDCKPNNIGKLIKNNKVHYKNLDPVKEAINYTTDNLEDLSEGELIIIDNDYVYSLEDFKKLPEDSQELYWDAIKEYEEKYKKEGRGK